MYKGGSLATNDHIWLQMQINGYTSSNLTLTSCLQAKYGPAFGGKGFEARCCIV